LADDLRADLAGLDPDIAGRLEALGFDPEQLIAWAGTIAGGPQRNRVRGTVEPPAPGDVSQLPPADSEHGRRLTEQGLQALAAGEFAMVVMAGGMATRMGGVVKALVQALPGRTFLDLRIAERDRWVRRTGVPLSLWVMSSHATDADIRAALPLGSGVEVFGQFVSLRLTPAGRLFRDASGGPSVHATGHGDLPDALRRSGILDRFLADGGRHLLIANLDNLGAGIDPRLLGWHMEQPQPLTVEVAAKEGGDKGGIPVRWDGRPVILEDFRLPEAFDAAAVDVFNTNTVTVDAHALAALDMAWTYFTVTKQVDDSPAVQFERLIGELTSGLETGFVQVPRSGPESRFLPVKDGLELERRRVEIARRMVRILN
jgi:UTP--glucose-1-phosphate uridylyltransferase